MLVSRQLYDQAYSKLGENWKKAAFIPYPTWTSWQQAMWVWRNKPLAEAYWNDVDIVYCPAESYVPTKKAKLVCTIHDVAGFEEDLYPNDRSRRMHCFKWRGLFNQMAKHADVVVTVSEFSASRIAHFFPELESKLRVIYNAPHPVFGASLTSPLEQQVDELVGSMPFVLVPGGLSFRKNAELIIQAITPLAEALPDVKLVVAGSCGGDYLEQAQALGIKNLVLPGYVSDELLNALYQKAQVVWFPTRYEGFGMPVIEAMAAGAAVVSTQTSSIPEVVGKAALLCDIDRPMEHVEAIQSLVSSAQNRNEMRQRSNEQVQRFTWDASAKQLENLFQTC